MNVSNNKLLTKLLTSVESSKLILICDELSSQSNQLIDCFINNRLKELKVNLIVIESDPQKDFNLTKFKQKSNNLKIIDLFTKFHTIESNLSQEIVESLTNVSNDSIVLIDSLTPLLMIDDLQQICCALNQLSNRFQQLICVLHIDCHSELIETSFERIADSIIRLNKSNNKSLNSFKAFITRRKPHRRTHLTAQESVELFEVKDNNIQYINTENITKVVQNLTTTTTDPTLNLPFNLNLKDDEIKAKNDLTLPYVKTSNNDSKIYYEFDKNDDIDEDDPDDDLDI